MRVSIAALLLLSLSVAGVPAWSQSDGDQATAIFAGGCFWCVEEAFSKIEGVSGHESGFAGGHVEHPGYDEVVAGGTGHHEAVKVTYDPDVVSYEQLLYVFWRNIDPLDAGGQFCDRGEPYQSAIFVSHDAEREAAEASLAELEASGRFDDPIATRILARGSFYSAEAYHQGYFKKRPLRYRFYVSRCGRYSRLSALWGDEARPDRP